MDLRKFRKSIYAHFGKEMRVFPWRRTRDPYRVLVSEVMLQQTQAPRVVKKYEEWVRVFPDFKALARATPAKVLRVWQGLGYNRRALALRRAAEIVVSDHGGKLPKEERALLALPGVGPYTARAVRCFAFGEPAAFIETNIRTVFIHFFFKKRKKVSDKELMPLIEKTLDRKDPKQWYFALMDYGVFLKKTENFSRRSAHYKKQSPFKGSHRETRGKIIRLVLKEKRVPVAALARLLEESKGKAARAAAELVRERFLKIERGNYLLFAP